MLRLFRLIALLGACPLASAARGETPIPIVAAENFYGDVAGQIGGASVSVRSILSNPDQDPHLFEASPSVARSLAGARIVVYNGADYDPWMAKLLASSGGRDRAVIVVADLVGKQPGDNPHLWYEPTTMPAFAKALAGTLSEADPAHAADYQARLRTFAGSLQPLAAKIDALRRQLTGAPVTATEPVFGYMLAALGLVDRNAAFQLAVMNGTEPSAASVAAFEHDLRSRQVRFLVYNSQATDPLASRMEGIAKQSHVPVVAVTETEPPGSTYQEWMLRELEAVDRAVNGIR
ncbi:MAG: metal ABC transporter solute-binding protein [Acetobacteraceae bacterium]|nr:metal ABC transporter solute-binding protein [Acetobacteraceae bacterium]